MALPLLAGLTGVQALQLGLGAVSAYAKIQAGRAAAGTAEQQAEQMEIDGIANEAKAMDNMAERFRTYEDQMAANYSVFGLMNRNPDDLVAFEDEEKTVLMRDLKSLRVNRELEKGQAKLAASIEVARGRNAMSAAMIGAVSSFGQSYYNAATTTT